MVIFMVTNIVPKITSIFESQEEALPMPTRILMGISEFVVNHWLLLIFIILLVTAAAKIFFQERTR